MKTLIYLLRKKKNKEGKSPLYLRFTEEGVRAEVFTSIYVYPEEWDNDNKQIIGNETRIRLKSNRLTSIQLEAEKLIEDYSSRNEFLSVQTAKEKLEGVLNGNKSPQRQQKKIPTFLEVLQLYIQAQRANIGKPKVDGGIVEGTFSTYLYRQKRIKEFLASIHLSGIRAENINRELISRFIAWARDSNQDFGHNHVNKHIKLFKTVVKYAFENHMSPQNSLMGLRVKEVRTTNVFLSQAELRKIMLYKFASQRLQQVADIFIVQCYTGFSYVDLMQFDVEKNIKKNDDGSVWIKYEREKSEIRALLPLFSEVSRILRKYDGKLPRITNQKYNAYIKEVADIVGIDKHLTTHMARKTCGTITLNAGFSLESVSRMLGHASVKTTERLYAEVLEERMIKESAKSTMFSGSITVNFNQETLFDRTA